MRWRRPRATRITSTREGHRPIAAAPQVEVGDVARAGASAGWGGWRLAGRPAITRLPGVRRDRPRPGRAGRRVSVAVPVGDPEGNGYFIRPRRPLPTAISRLRRQFMPCLRVHLSLVKATGAAAFLHWLWRILHFKFEFGHHNSSMLTDTPVIGPYIFETLREHIWLSSGHIPMVVSASMTALDRLSQSGFPVCQPGAPSRSSLARFPERK